MDRRDATRIPALANEGDRRYAPERPLPAYAFVPGGGRSHPRKDRAGHAPEMAEPSPQPLRHERWRENEDFRYGVDLFNFGYYWEAHEVFEAVWHAAGRLGTTAELLKGLIKLCAAEIKRRQGLPGGVRKHGAAARAHFERVVAARGARFAGLDVAELCAVAEAIAREPSAGDGREGRSAVRGAPRLRLV